jgi:hypothetical protein
MARTELQSNGSQLQFNKIAGPGDPVQRSIQIGGAHKVVSATVQAYSNGMVALSDTLTNTAPRAPIHQMNSGEVSRWLIGVIKGMAKN